MALDFSMYNALMQKPKTVAEYDADAVQGKTNALALQMGQQKADEYTRSVADGNRLRQVVSGFGDDPAANTNMLLKAGRLTEAQAYQKSNAEALAKTADVGKTKEETAKMQKESAAHQFEIAGQLASAWATNPGVTKAQIQAGLAAASHSGVISPEITQAKMTELEGMADNPQALNGWAKGTLQQVMKAKDSMSYIAPDAGQLLTAKTQVDTNAATNATSRANNASTNATTQRGQNMVDARTREANQAPKGQVVQTDNGPMVVDPRTGKGTAVTLNGAPVAPKGTNQKIEDAKSVIGLLDLAAPLLDTATHSRIGQAYDATLASVGQSTEGAQAAAQLRALEGALIAKQPKMSGPQSDKDVLLYRQMAGQIGDPSVPVETRKAAMKAVRALNEKYAGATPPVAPSAGIPSGWSVKEH